MSQPWNIGTPNPPSGSAPIGSGGQYYPGSAEDQALRQKTAQQGVLGGAADAIGSDIGSAIAGAFKGIAGPITAMFGVKEAGVINSFNEVVNTIIYGAMAAAGGLLMAWGLYEVGKDAGVSDGGVLGKAAGVGSMLVPEFKLGKMVSGGAGVAKSTGSEFKLAAGRDKKVKAPKVVKEAAPAKPKNPGGREAAARKAGMGAAQILRARREDAE